MQASLDNVTTTTMHPAALDTSTLATTAATYPYLRGLWTIPLRVGMALADVFNLEQAPSNPILVGLLVGGLALCGGASWFIVRHYREHYGDVTPTKSRQRRQAVAIGAWIAVLFVAAYERLLWSPDSRLCVYGAAFSAATLVYYAILVGLRPQHVAVWVPVFVVSLLPLWGGLGTDRDAIAMVPLGAALILSGLLDQRLLARTLGSGADDAPRRTSHDGR